MKKFCINQVTDPRGSKKDEYDVVVVGAGIGGLVCGTYLAKSGMKVAIVEKNPKVGGYCSSFERNGFFFDSCVHFLGGCRDQGSIRRLLRDLNIEEKVKLHRHNPSDVVVTPDFILKIANNENEVISELQKQFPHQAKEINSFFEYILNADFITIFLKFKSKTFKELLLSFFTDVRLMNLLSIFLGNVGLPATLVSAITAVMLYREFVLDGGYYPKGGIQSFAQCLVEKFDEYGGKLFLMKEVRKIKIKDNFVEGVVTGGGEFIKAKYVVSNSDSRRTFLGLIGRNYLSKNFSANLNNMIPSSSAFIVYLGLKSNFEMPYQDTGSSIWYCPCYNEIDDLFSKIFKGKVDVLDRNMLCFSPSSHKYHSSCHQKKTLCLMVNVSFKTQAFWRQQKEYYRDRLIKRCQELMPNLSSCIDLCVTATPATLHKYTFNYKGAAYGWAPFVNQINRQAAPHKTFIKNLYLVGHWTTQGHGIPMVVKSGMLVSDSIIRNKKLWNA